MTAYVARNKTEEIAFVSTSADEALTNWAVKLSKEYISLPAKVYQLQPYVTSSSLSSGKEAN
jgi:leucyl aminopeptidase